MAWLLAGTALICSALARPDDVAEREVDEVTLLQMTTDWSPGNSEETTKQPNLRPFAQTLVNDGDTQYLAHVILGSQTLTALLDTSSYDLVVFDGECPGCGEGYSPTSSSSFVESAARTVQNVSGAGSAEASLAKDNFSVGPFRLDGQHFWNVQRADKSSLGGPFQAVLGLGPPDAPVWDAWAAAEEAVKDVQAFYSDGVLAPKSYIVEAKKAIEDARAFLDRPPPLRSMECVRFSLCLGGKAGSDGLLVWNDEAPGKKPHYFAKIPATSPGWTVQLSDAGLSSSSDTLACAEGCPAALDSSKSMLAVPPAVVQALREAFRRTVKPDCSNLEALPHLRFQLGGKPLSLPPDSYVAAVVVDSPEFAHLAAEDGWQCRLLVQESSSGWTLGLPFFRRYYTSFFLHSGAKKHFVQVAPHTQESCEPASAAEASVREPPELRSVRASRLRL